MSIGERDIKGEREEIFLQMLEEEFLNANIVELLEPVYEGGPNRIRLEVLILTKTPDLGIRSIIFQPTESLMTDEGNSYKQIFRSAIINAKKILSDTPKKDQVTQCTIMLDSDKVTFDSHP